MALSEEGVKILGRTGLAREAFFHTCSVHKVSPTLMLAMIAVESSGNPNALRFERKYRWLYRERMFAKASGVSLDTERALQKFSYGVLQIMGATARYMGYRGHLMRLLKAEEGLAWGSLYFASLQYKYKNVEDAISAYNQGSPRKALLSDKYKNQRYVDSVLKKQSEVKR